MGLGACRHIDGFGCPAAVRGLFLCGVCTTPHLDVETIQQKFLIAYDRLMANREAVIADCDLIRSALSDCSAIDAELETLNEEINVVAGLVNACVKENASCAQSQEVYAKKYNGLLARYKKATARVKNSRQKKSVSRAKTGTYGFSSSH